MKRSLVLLLLWMEALAVSAADPAKTFDEANRLYEQGNFSEAAARYETIVKSGDVSAPLYFNYANALFRSGQVGRAILNYRLAERLAPRDPDIRANLRFARDSVAGNVSIKPPRWRDWLEYLTLNELAVMAAIALWIWFGLLGARQFQPAWRPALRGYTLTAGVAALLTTGWLAASAYVRFQYRTAVIVAPEAVVRYGPLEESQTLFTARDGTELAVIDRKGDWLQVRDAVGRIGWMRSDQAALFAPFREGPPHPAASGS